MIDGVMEQTSKEFSVLTFNVWGLYISKDRQARIKAIGDALADGEFDVVTLQELWVCKDYEMLKSKLMQSYAHSHHFSGGIVGSGLAVFSKHPIIQIDYRPYRLNGKPFYILHGDWYAGKGIGHVRLQHPETVIDIFTTHMIANYHNKKDGNDIYSVHRCLQMVEFCNHISTFKSQDSLVIATGDFNIEDNDQLLSEVVDKGMFLNSGPFTLKSVWKESSTIDKMTFNRPTNSYHKSEKDPECIDYIWYDSAKASIRDVKLKFDDLIESIGKSYSDHTGVAATFTLEDRDSVARSSGKSLLGEYFYRQAKGYVTGLENRQAMLQFVLATSFCALISISAYTTKVHNSYSLKTGLVSLFLLFTVLIFQYSNLWLNYEISMLKQVTAEWLCWLQQH